MSCALFQMDADMLIDLDVTDIELLREALDSHAYWQLSPDHARRDGFVILERITDEDDPDGEIREQLAMVVELDGRLTNATRPT